MQSDLNILQVWSQGLSGQGVVVSVLDDGIEKDHPDLWANYVSLQGWGGGFGRRGKGGEGMSETAEISHLLIARALEEDTAREPEGPTWASELGSSP